MDTAFPNYRLHVRVSLIAQIRAGIKERTIGLVERKTYPLPRLLNRLMMTCSSSLNIRVKMYDIRKRNEQHLILCNVNCILRRNEHHLILSNHYCFTDASLNSDNKYENAGKEFAMRDGWHNGRQQGTITLADCYYRLHFTCIYINIYHFSMIYNNHHVLYYYIMLVNSMLYILLFLSN